MNKRRTMSWTVSLLAAVLIMLGCGGGGQNPAPNGNMNGNANANANASRPADNSNSRDKVELMTDPCTEAIIRTGIETGFGASPSLQEQYTKAFDFQIFPRSDANGSYFEIYVGGTIGTGSDNQDQMYHFQRTMRKYITRDCVRTVYFGPRRITPIPPTERLGGFKWGTCEDGKDPCSDGSCSRPCPVMFGQDAEPDSKSNANSSGSSNANANAGPKGNSAKP